MYKEIIRYYSTFLVSLVATKVMQFSKYYIVLQFVKCYGSLSNFVCYQAKPWPMRMDNVGIFADHQRVRYNRIRE